MRWRIELKKKKITLPFCERDVLPRRNELTGSFQRKLHVHQISIAIFFLHLKGEHFAAIQS